MLDVDNAEQILQSIGLSTSAARCYLYLVNESPRAVKAAELTAQLRIAKASTYRALEELANKGFVQTTRIVMATSYRAEPLAQAMDKYAEYQRTLVRPIIATGRLA